jgi:hypothetical protein
MRRGDARRGAIGIRCACTVVVASLATLVCIDAAAAQPELDLRIEQHALPVGPLREEAADDEAEAPEDDSAADEEAPAPLDAEDLAVRAVVPEPPAARTPIGPPPTSPTGRVPGTGAPNLYAQFTAGTGLGGTLGGRVGPRLGLGFGFRGTPYGFAVHAKTHGLDELFVSNISIFGPTADWYPRRGVAHLRLRLGAAAVGLRETRIIDMIAVETEPLRFGPALELGVGMQWRPIGTFGRFRLGLVIESGASTVTSGPNRIGVFDLGLSTTVTWF